MINYKILFSLTILFLIPLVTDNSFAQIKSGGFGDSPFEREFGDVKFLDAYFGTVGKKIEVDPGDENVPFTVIFANVGTQDITGIKGQLSLPMGFSAAADHSSLIIADSNSQSLAGNTFHITFYVNVDKNIRIQQYPGTVKIDYSRLRESGVRTSFSDFNFKITGNSILNVKALDPFLISLKTNNVIIEISNNGTAPLSTVRIVATNTGTSGVVLLESNWDVGNIAPQSSRYITATVYVPENLKGKTLQIPLTIKYYTAQGELKTVSATVDFYIKGLIDISIYDVGVIELSGKQMVVGEIINEGNENALFSFVTLEPLDDSNIKNKTQFIDEVEIDSPLPFNIPLEFDGQPRYGEHKIKLTLRYKDSVRDEIFVIHNATIFVKEPPKIESVNYSQLIIIPIIIVVAIGIYMIRRRKKSKIQAN